MDIYDINSFEKLAEPEEEKKVVEALELVIIEIFVEETALEKLAELA